MEKYKKTIDPNDVPEFRGQIIDIFEDLLEEKGIGKEYFPSDEREEYENIEGEDDAILFGSDYAAIQDQLEDLLINWGVIDADWMELQHSASSQYNKAHEACSFVLENLTALANGNMYECPHCMKHFVGVEEDDDYENCPVCSFSFLKRECLYDLAKYLLDWQEHNVDEVEYVILCGQAPPCYLGTRFHITSDVYNYDIWIDTRNSRIEAYKDGEYTGVSLKIAEELNNALNDVWCEQYGFEMANIINC